MIGEGALLNIFPKKKISKKIFLDIGGAFGNLKMRSFGLSVDLIDKYEEKAEFRGDSILLISRKNMI